MKTKLSISIDENILSQVDELVEAGLFRNRSHAVDLSIRIGGAENGNR